MVDVSTKDTTVRRALASGCVSMRPATADLIRSGHAAKGDVLGVARIAGISASKLTAQLIPLCHTIPIESVSVDFRWRSDDSRSESEAVLQCVVDVRTTAKTGVEMEAMTATAIACLTIYDMVKSVDRDVRIGPIELLKKSGGKSGEYSRRAD